MLFNGDILRSIIEFDPDYSHKLVSKQFSQICNNLSTYMDVWNLRFEQDSKALDYIDRNILYIQKWGTQEDQDWYRKVMTPSVLTLTDINNDNNHTDWEYLLSTCELATFQYHFSNHPNVANLDMDRLFFLIGINNNVEIFEYLVSENIEVRLSIFHSAISNGKVGILKALQNYFGKKPNFILTLPNTIESYAKEEVREILNDMEILDAIVPIKIPLSVFNITSKNFLRGLKTLKKELKDLDFRALTTSIYIHGIEPFTIYSRECVKMLSVNRYYDYKLFVQILKACLQYSWINILDYLWINDYDNMPNNMVRFIEANHVYVNLTSFKWVESVYFLEQKDYKKIYKNNDVRNLSTAIYVLRKIIKL